MSNFRKTRILRAIFRQKVGAKIVSARVFLSTQKPKKMIISSVFLVEQKKQKFDQKMRY